MLTIASHPTYALIDMGAIHCCVSEEYMSTCGLIVEVIPDLAMCVNNFLKSGSLMTRVLRFVDVVVEDLHMPIDLLILPMFEFDVILGMNSLNQYRVTIGCYGTTWSF